MKPIIDRSSQLETLRNKISNLNTVQRTEVRDYEVRVYRNHECILTIDNSLEITEHSEGLEDLVEEVQDLINEVK